MTDDPYTKTPGGRDFSEFQPFYRRQCEAEDAAPRLRAPWWVLALLTAAIGAWSLVYGMYLFAAWILGQMIDVALSIGWPT